MMVCKTGEQTCPTLIRLAAGCNWKHPTVLAPVAVHRLVVIGSTLQCLLLWRCIVCNWKHPTVLAPVAVHRLVVIGSTLQCLLLWRCIVCNWKHPTVLAPVAVHRLRSFINYLSCLVAIIYSGVLLIKWYLIGENSAIIIVYSSLSLQILVAAS